MQEKKIAIEYPDDFIKKVMAHQASRQEKATSHLGPEGREMIARLDSFFWKVILVVGKCIKVERHPLAMRLILGRFDDLMSLDGLPGGAMSASLEEIQESCERQVRQQDTEIRRESLGAEDARDVADIVDIVMDLALHIGRTTTVRFLFASLAREQIKDMMTILDGPDHGILGIPRSTN